MNICYISTFLPERCGIATYTNYLVHGLFEVDDEVKITILARQGAKEQESKNFKVLPCFSQGEYKNILSNLEKLNYQIVHIQHEFGIFPSSEGLLSLFKSIKTLGYPLIITFHTIYTKEYPAKREFNGIDAEDYHRKIGDLVDCQIVHLDRPLKRVLLRMGISSEKIEVIPHGTELLESSDASWAKEKLGLPKGRLIVDFGFIKRSKNQLSIIEALPLIIREVPDAYLFIAGYSRIMDPDDLFYIGLCKNRAKELGVEDKVIFSDEFIPDKKVPLVFSAADCCCYLYDDECRSGSGAIHLALGSGKPIVASRIPKFEEELMGNISDEILCLPHDIDMIANIIIRFLKDEIFRDQIIESVKRYGQATSWKEIAKKHLRLYQKFWKR